ncbi:MAG: glycosyltransferase family 39 protein, partial [Lutibacter sp.]|nr:glycosyltransferase family 39 protein [Lutibacter sp.]
MKRKNGFYLLLIILFLAFFIRSFGLNQPFYDDEIDYIKGIYEPDKFGLNPAVVLPPLTSWINKLVGLFFGTEYWIFRFVMLLFGLGTIILTYLISMQIYKNQKSALLAVTIMSFSFYHILASLQMGEEGSSLTFFMALFVYIYIIYKKNNSFNYLLLLGFIFGVSILIKSNAILILGVIGVYEFWINRKDNPKLIIMKLFKLVTPILLIGLLMFSIFPILSYLGDSYIWTAFITHMGARTTMAFSFLGFSMFLFWATPFLIGLFLVSIRKVNKDNNLFIIWFFLIFLFYTFGSTNGDFSRYYMNLIVPISLISGNFLAKIKWEPSYLYQGGFIFIIFYLFFNRLNQGVFGFVPRLMEYYIPNLTNFNWNFLFTYTSSSGPMFMISFSSIIIAFII